MSGTSDTSTPADRARFCALLFNSAAGPLLGQQVAVVQNCTLRLPEADAMMLGLPERATYAQAAALLATRWQSGQAAY